MDEKDLMIKAEDFFDEEGNFLSEKMEKKISMLNSYLKSHIMTEHPQLKDKQAEKLAQEVIHDLFSKALKNPNANSKIKAWFWWRNNGDTVNALFIGIIVAIIAKFFF